MQITRHALSTQEDKHMNIAIIGAGEVGRTYAKAVAEQSVHTAILCDPYPNDRTLRFVSEAGLELHGQARRMAR